MPGCLAAWLPGHEGARPYSPCHRRPASNGSVASAPLAAGLARRSCQRLTVSGQLATTRLTSDARMFNASAVASQAPNTQRALAARFVRDPTPPRLFKSARKLQVRGRAPRGQGPIPSQSSWHAPKFQPRACSKLQLRPAACVRLAQCLRTLGGTLSLRGPDGAAPPAPSS